jgi:hypothetical protein
MNKIIHPVEPEELMAYLDGEVPSRRAEIAAAHLIECAECREVVAGLRHVSQGLGVWGVESTADSFPPTVSVALDENPERRGEIPMAPRSWRNNFRQHWQATAWAGGFAALVLVAYMGTVSLKGRSADMVDMAVVRQEPGSEPSRRGGNAEYPALRTASGKSSSGISPQTKQFDNLEQFGKLSQAPQATLAAAGDKISPAARETMTAGPMIIRTAQLSLITKDFDSARAAMETILKRHRGYVADLKTGGATGSGRTLTATLRVPADQLDASLIDLKALGRLESESQSGQDVTSQYVDLQARLANARNTEQRLTDLLRNRTGKLSDVLEVEQEVDRVRGEIEQMEAERKNMSNQVSYATLNVSITEDYKAQLQVVPPSTWTRLTNASVEGYKSMVEGVMSLALFLLENGPSLLLWIAIFFLPARLVWKRVRRSFAP